MLTVQPSPLERFTTEVFAAIGADEDVAVEVARHLVLCNLSGHDSHGMQRIPTYIELAERSALVPSARPEVIRETPVSVLVDGHRSFRQFSTAFTLERCIEKITARPGVAVGAVRRSAHTGRMGTYSEAAAGQGLICIACEPPFRHLTVTHGRKGSRIRRPDQLGAVANGGGRRRRTEGQVSRDTFLTHDGVR